jgi:hypothetical protein
MNILGKLPESTAVTGTIDYVGFLKIVRTAIVAGGAMVCTSVLQSLTGFHLFQNEALNAMVITGVFVPLIEAARRWAVNYAAS